jgi:hypothetical protein
MAPAQLNFSTSRILRLAFIAIFLGTASAGLGYALRDAELMRHAHILRLLGPVGARCFLIAAGLFMTWSGLALLRRLVESRPAAAIRYDGIELNGVFMSRYIPWRSLDRLYLRQWRHRGKIHHYIKVEARRPPTGSIIHHFLAARSYGVSTGLIDATGAEVAHWVEMANAARPSASAPRPPAATHRSAPAKIGFGRRPA